MSTQQELDLARNAAVAPRPDRAGSDARPGADRRIHAVPAEALPAERAEPLLADVAELSPGTGCLLDVASVLGGTFSVDDLVAALGEPVGRVLPALRELLDAEVLVSTAEVLRFRHEPVRDAVYRRIAEPIRLALHRQIGGMLLERGGAPAAAATHLVEGTRPGERAAIGTLDQAARELIAAAPPAAADLALRALELTDVTDDSRHARAATAVDALFGAGLLDEASRRAHATLALPRLPAQCAARLRLTLSSLLLMAGHPEQAVAQADAVLAERGLPDDIAGAAELARLRALLILDDGPRVQAAAEDILAGGGRPGSSSSIALAVTALACTAWDQGHVSVALGLLRAAVLRAERDPAPGLYPRLPLVTMLTALGELDEAETAASQAATEIRLAADTMSEAAPPLFAARAQLAAGRLDEAIAAAREALRTAVEMDTRLFVPLALATLAQAAVHRGDLRAAHEYLQRYRRELAPPHRRLGPLARTWCEARLAEAQDGPAAAVALLADLYESVPAQPILLVEEPAAAAWLTRIALAAGEQGRAEQVVRAATQLATANPGVRAITAAAAHARGLVERDAVMLAGAAGRYQQPWTTASATEDAGRVFAAGGDRAAAR
ncbi:MAG: hypothetical protein V7637_34, partial [Mycobacteriales bacterium]